jgi:hypothetical protein
MCVDSIMGTTILTTGRFLPVSTKEIALNTAMIEQLDVVPTVQDRRDRMDRFSMPFGRFFLCMVFGLQIVGRIANAQTVGSHSKDGQLISMPTPAQVSQAIALSATYMERACGPDGKFVYKVKLGSDHESPTYDIIRHEGAIYALAMLNHSHQDPQAVAAMVRAAAFLRQNYIGPGVQPGQEVVWSKPLTNGDFSSDDYAELGGTGLGLVALSAVHQARPKSQTIKQLQALGRFARFLQRDDGSFIHKYSAKNGPVLKWNSLYYPGEAALGFIALYEADHSGVWLIAAGKALSYLAKSRAGLSTVPADHWALIATAKLLPYCERTPCGASREELVQHAIQICNSILHEQIRGSRVVGLDGAFDPDGRTAPAATRIEGLLAALEFLPKGELRSNIEAEVGRGIAFLLRAQITFGPEAGGMLGTIIPGHRSSSEVRIDFVQHALCAWLRYQRFIENSAEARD